MSDTPNVTKKRFIAGAVCPACSAQDTIKMWNVDGVPHRECVACGYADTLDARGNSVPNELPTRVNATALKPKKPADPSVKAVQFFPNPKLKKPDPDA
ncbi:YheV family putative zinc ribbon protein [Pseudomonas sp. Marseille-QA0892]